MAHQPAMRSLAAHILAESQPEDADVLQAGADEEQSGAAVGQTGQAGARAETGYIRSIEVFMANEKLAQAARAMATSFEKSYGDACTPVQSASVQSAPAAVKPRPKPARFVNPGLELARRADIVRRIERHARMQAALKTPVNSVPRFCQTPSAGSAHSQSPPGWLPGSPQRIRDLEECSNALRELQDLFRRTSSEVVRVGLGSAIAIVEREQSRLAAQWARDGYADISPCLLAQPEAAEAGTGRGATTADVYLIAVRTVDGLRAQMEAAETARDYERHAARRARVLRELREWAESRV